MKEKVTWIKITKFKEFPQNKYSVEDLIYWLFGIDNVPIYGRIPLFKMLFLEYVDVLPEYIKNSIPEPMFVPYKYGPYSFFIANVIEDMVFDGYLKVEGKKNSRKECFELTDKGKVVAKKRLEKIDDDTKEKLKNSKKAWIQKGYDGILHYVYARFPQYTEKSLIKDKMDFNTWEKELWNNGIWDIGRKG